MINSLDEAIKNCEKVADGFDVKAQEIAMQDENGVYQPRVSWYQDRASSQRQLAEWLRELKAYRGILANADKTIESIYGCVIIEGYKDVIDQMNELYSEVNANDE